MTMQMGMRFVMDLMAEHGISGDGEMMGGHHHDHSNQLEVYFEKQKNGVLMVVTVMVMVVMVIEFRVS